MYTLTSQLEDAVKDLTEVIEMDDDQVDIKVGYYNMAVRMVSVANVPPLSCSGLTITAGHPAMSGQI